MSYKKIGIIGGAGPEATYKLHKLIIEKCIAQGNYYDWEFPHLIIDNVPFEDLVANKLPNKILTQFEESLKFLETRGASQILVNCNSIYALINTDKYNIVNLPEQVYQILKTTPPPAGPLPSIPKEHSITAKSCFPCSFLHFRMSM